MAEAQAFPWGTCSWRACPWGSPTRVPRPGLQWHGLDFHYPGDRPDGAATTTHFPLNPGSIRAWQSRLYGLLVGLVGGARVVPVPERAKPSTEGLARNWWPRRFRCGPATEVVRRCRTNARRCRRRRRECAVSQRGAGDRPESEVDDEPDLHGPS